MYFGSILPNTRNMWKTIQNIAGKKEFVTPRKIISKGTYIRSQKKIANVMNDFFIDKIEEIQEQFTEPKLDPLYFLRNLVPKPTS